MKIAIVVSGRPHESGVTTYINTIVDPLRSLGHLVDVITLFGTSDYREVKKEFVEKSDRLLKGRAILVIPAYLASQGVILWHLLGSHLRKRYDVLYAIDVSVANVALLVRRLVPARVFLRVGASVAKDMVAQGKLSATSPLLSFFHWEERRAYSRVDAVLPNSTWSYHHVASLCPQARLLPPIVSPVDQHDFRPNETAGQAKRRELGISAEDVVILFPSRLDQRKGPAVALRAFRELLSRGNHYRLAYVGRGTERGEIERLITEWGLGACVRLLGMVPHSEMPALYNMADVVVVPSVTHHGYEEPLANCILEAMACGVPVIASAIGGLKDFIQSGRNGTLVPEGNHIALAHEIERLQQDTAYRRIVISGGMDTVQRHCSPSAVASKLVEVFCLAHVGTGPMLMREP